MDSSPKQRNMRSRYNNVEDRPSAPVPSEGLGPRLRDLRCLRDMTQLALAETMAIGQTALSHLEHRDDLLLSSVMDYVTALGGCLNIAATFPNGDLFKLLGDANWVPSAITNPDATNGQLCLPSILGPEQRPPSRDVVFSIRPPHASKILNGTKTVELRRRFTVGVKPGTLALIYTTSPTSALTGFAKIQDVQCLALTELWKKHRSAACLEKDDFETYFSGLKRGYAIVLNSAQALARPVALPELRKRFGFEPPQSYQYASPHMRGLVEYEWSQAPN
jgi:predicted transcriptional regulator